MDVFKRIQRIKMCKYVGITFSGMPEFVVFQNSIWVNDSRLSDNYFLKLRIKQHCRNIYLYILVSWNVIVVCNSKRIYLLGHL